MDILKYSQFNEGQDVNIRKAVPDDYPRIKKISNQHREYLPFVMRVAIGESIKRGGVYVAEIGGDIVGFVHFHKRMDGITTLHEIGVGLGYEKMGIGRKLISTMERPIQLKVTKDNPANDFYKKLGFKFVREIRGKKRDLNLYTSE